MAERGTYHYWVLFGTVEKKKMDSSGGQAESGDTGETGDTGEKGEKTEKKEGEEEQTQNGPVPVYDLLLRTERLDIFAETITYEYETSTKIQQNIVYLLFDKSGRKIIQTSGYQRTIVMTDAGQTVDHSKLYISPGFASVIQMSVEFARPKTVWDKYWEFILAPGDPKYRFKDPFVPEPPKKNRLNATTGRHM